MMTAPVDPANGSPEISVIVPARNEEASLAACLESLVAQEGVDFEIIVVDDASTDGAWEVLQSWRRAGRAALRQDEALGSYAARNQGFAMAGD